AEDGIRDLIVTGVQTCALPISHVNVGIVGAGIFGLSTALALAHGHHRVTVFDRQVPPVEDAASTDRTKALRFEYGAASPLYAPRSEERRVGGGCRARVGCASGV